MSDPVSAVVSVGAACSGALPATSFDTAELGLVAGSRAGVVPVVTAIVIILQSCTAGLVTR
jgi:hypothetical protein